MAARLMPKWLDDYTAAARRHTGPIPKRVRKLYEAQMDATEHNLAVERQRLASYEREVAKHLDVYIPACKRRIAELEAQTQVREQGDG